MTLLLLLTQLQPPPRLQKNITDESEIQILPGPSHSSIHQDIYRIYASAKQWISILHYIPQVFHQVTTLHYITT